jgi:acyl-CoA reductase-like NAD-dependent aldehyde dehydrogenase
MTFTSVNPHDPSDVVGEWDSASEREVAAVVERARRGAEAWRRTPAAARSAALGNAAEAAAQRAGEITALTVREVG